MATKFRIEGLVGKKWTFDPQTPTYDKRDEAIPVAEYISKVRSLQTRIVKVQTKIVWQSKKPELIPPK